MKHINEENLCCTLEQAKKLKALGVTQNSFFWVREHLNQETGAPEYTSFEAADWRLIETGLLKTYTTASQEEAPIYAAYTAQELGTMLPFHDLKGGYEMNFLRESFEGGWECKIWYPNRSGGYTWAPEWKREEFMPNINLAVVTADVVLWLFKYDYTNIEKVNHKIENF